jgi:hypothetical protein
MVIYGKIPENQTRGIDLAAKDSHVNGLHALLGGFMNIGCQLFRVHKCPDYSF